ncbi:hypothetical protein ABVT39_005855 [Epinephelus coioides]
MKSDDRANVDATGSNSSSDNGTQRDVKETLRSDLYHPAMTPHHISGALHDVCDYHTARRVSADDG